MSGLVLPRRGRGRPSEASRAAHQEVVAQFCRDILEIASRLDFQMSARGWGYYLEGQRAIDKGDIDLVERQINDCRKSGGLPVDICAEDGRRAFENNEDIDDDDPEEFAEAIVVYTTEAHFGYAPFSFWDDKDVYIQMLTEKSDLKSLFKSVCAPFRIPIANGAGWTDLNLRAEMMRRSAEWEARGKRCVLLYVGDFDPGGLHISEFLRSNMEDLSGAVGWKPNNLIIDRFGLNFEYIGEHGLIWIDNLITGSGQNLADPKHEDHSKPYVRDYIARYGVRKVEANALLADPDAGRELCRQTIQRYLPEDAPDRYREALAPHREQVRAEILRRLEETYR